MGAENRARLKGRVWEPAEPPGSCGKLIGVVSRCTLTSSRFWGKKQLSLCLEEETRDRPGLMYQSSVAAETKKGSRIKWFKTTSQLLPVGDPGRPGSAGLSVCASPGGGHGVSGARRSVHVPSRGQSSFPACSAGGPSPAPLLTLPLVPPSAGRQPCF